MDCIMEGQHRVVEGMLIASCHWRKSGLCLYADRIPFGCQRMQKALDAASHGLLVRTFGQRLKL